MLRFFRDPQTKDFLIAGTGQQHIEVVVSKLKRRYHTEVVLKAPKVPYRETIRGTADVQGRHKKQSGGHGQFGDCKIRMSPLPRGAQFEFVNDIFGGAIPKNFIPAVEKGILEAAARGFLAGYPVVDFKVSLYDGSYHDVDSNELSFKTAGRIAFKKAMEAAKPTLLEPIMQIEITVPDEFAGAIMGDMNSRRGRIQGMDNKAGNTIIRAHAPMSEMLTYGTDLTAMTQGRGSFNMEMDHYDFVPVRAGHAIARSSSGLANGLQQRAIELRLPGHRADRSRKGDLGLHRLAGPDQGHRVQHRDVFLGRHRLAALAPQIAAETLRRGQIADRLPRGDIRCIRSTGRTPSGTATASIFSIIVALPM